MEHSDAGGSQPRSSPSPSSVPPLQADERSRSGTGVQSSALLQTGSSAVHSSSTLLAGMESPGWKQLVRVPSMQSEEKSAGRANPAAQMGSAAGHVFCLQQTTGERMGVMLGSVSKSSMLDYIQTNES